MEIKKQINCSEFFFIFIYNLRKFNKIYLQNLTVKNK